MAKKEVQKQNTKQKKLPFYEVESLETNSTQRLNYRIARYGARASGVVTVLSGGVFLFAKDAFDKGKELGNSVVNNANELAVYTSGSLLAVSAIVTAVSAFSEGKNKRSIRRVHEEKQELRHQIDQLNTRSATEVSIDDRSKARFDPPQKVAPVNELPVMPRTPRNVGSDRTMAPELFQANVVTPSVEPDEFDQHFGNYGETQPQ